LKGHLPLIENPIGEIIYLELMLKLENGPDGDRNQEISGALENPVFHRFETPKTIEFLGAKEILDFLDPRIKINPLALKT
jgi:hypothetical protein